MTRLTGRTEAGGSRIEPEAIVLDERQIEIGDRVRTDPGDIESLAESIRLLGLLHPVVVRRLGPNHYKLVAGYRRILALRRLGRPIPVIVTTNIEDELAALQAERDENIERKEFTPDEALVMRDLIIEAEGLAEQAKQRQGTGAQHARIVRKSRDKTPGQTARSASPNVGEAKPPTARHSREKKRQAARATGYGATTLDKVEKVKTAAEDPALPAPKRRLVRIARDEMNATGNVSQALRTVQEVTGTHAPAPPEIGEEPNKRLRPPSPSNLQKEKVLGTMREISHDRLDPLLAYLADYVVPLNRHPWIQSLRDKLGSLLGEGGER